MKSPNTEKKTSEELREEVSYELNNVRRGIDKIQGRLTPGQIIDDAIFYNHGGTTAGAFDHLKNNPVGTAFLSLGTLLLMEDQNQSSVETSVRDKMTGFKHDMKSRSLDLKNSFNAKKNEIKDTIQKKKEEFQSRKSYGADFEGLDDEAMLSKTSTKEKMREGLNKVRENLSTGLQTGKEKFQGLDPLTYMAIGAGLGALTGASLPVSEKERELVDTRFSEKFSDFTRDFQDAINESTNLLKNLVIDDVKDRSIHLF